MSSYRSQDSRPPAYDTYPRPRYNRDPYPNRRSPSLSIGRTYSSPQRRRSPSHDSSKTPPRGPAADMRSSATIRDWDERHDRDRDASYRRLSPSPYRGRDGYRDRDEPRYQSPGYDSRSRSRSPSRSPRAKNRDRSRDRSPYFGGSPSKEVIMEGLPVDMVEDDISNELKQYLNAEDLEDVRVIRDRQTKISRQFGFLRFSTLELSRSFLERNYPLIYLYGSSSTGGEEQAAKVRISYSRERDSDRPRSDTDWHCRVCNTSNYSTRVRCFRCQNPKPEHDAPPTQSRPHHANNGDSDVSPENAPSQFLIIRGLEPTVTEELLLKGVSKLYKSSGSTTQAPPSAAKKGFKVASTTGDTNLGAKEGTIRRVLLVRDRRSNESWRYGFAEFATVDDAQAALIRYNSFEKFTISSRPVLASYIHAGVFVPVLNPTPVTERFTFSPLSNSAMKLTYWDENAYVTELTVSTGDSETENGNLSGNAKSKIDSNTADAEGLVKGSNDGEKSKKRKGDPTAVPAKKKAAPSHLQFWSNRHAELYGIEPKETTTSEPSEPKKEPAKSRASPSDGDAPPVQSFADLNRNCCLLCSRQFKTSTEVHKHERLSQLHRDNLSNDELKSKALAKMAKLGIEQPAQTDTEYRDRARERRQQHKHNLPTKTQSNSNESKKRSPSPEPAPVQSKGASLLSKMGYDPSSSTGLGAHGTGILTPIQTDAYAPGVGLGAEGGRRGDAVKEAEANTKDGAEGYKGWVERAKEGARARYERME